MSRRLVEWPCIESEGQILRLEVTADHPSERHFLILEERTLDVQRDYKVVGQIKTLSLSHHFDTIYGVSSIAGMDPETAIRVGEVMQEWGKAHR